MPKLIEFRYLYSNDEAIKNKADMMGVDMSVLQQEVEQVWYEKIINILHVTDIDRITINFDDATITCARITIGGTQYITDIEYEEFVGVWKGEFGDVLTYIEGNIEGEES